jgi:protein-L-isoaspartate(D-aspartate) O-methyltransferase
MNDKERMIDIHLKQRGITDERVLDAFFTVPREEFIPEERHDSAYADHPLPIGYSQTISQPYIVALTIQALRIKNTDTVLELGAGSGYAAAIIAELAHKVITVERIPELAERASETLKRLGYINVKVVTADGTLGYEEKAPYNGIAVAAAAPKIPPSLLGQLAQGGRMVIPVGPEGFQQLLYIEKNDKGKIVEKRNICDCSFVPLIGREGY